MHLGTLVSVVVYVTISGRAAYSAAGVTRALWIALGTHTGYVLLARSLGELKQLDVGLWILFAVGAVAAAAGVTPVLGLFQRYTGALLFTTFGLTAALPLLLGREPFTVYYGVRQVPAWQTRTATFLHLSRVMAAFWTLVFFASAALCVARPTDPMFTFVYPNAIIFVIGMPAALWLPPLYLRVIPPPLPDAAEPLIMGLPFVFDPRAAGDASAVIQFRVTGACPGEYWVRVGDGRCATFEGSAPRADLTVHTPDEVWVDIAHGRLDGNQALADGRYRAEGDLLILAKFEAWFRSARS